MPGMPSIPSVPLLPRAPSRPSILVGTLKVHVADPAGRCPTLIHANPVPVSVSPMSCHPAGTLVVPVGGVDGVVPVDARM